MRQPNIKNKRNHKHIKHKNLIKTQPWLVKVLVSVSLVSWFITKLNLICAASGSWRSKRLVSKVTGMSLSRCRIRLMATSLLVVTRAQQSSSFDNTKARERFWWLSKATHLGHTGSHSQTFLLAEGQWSKIDQALDSIPGGRFLVSLGWGTTKGVGVYLCKPIASIKLLANTFSAKCANSCGECVLSPHAFRLTQTNPIYQSGPT